MQERAYQEETSRCEQFRLMVSATRSIVKLNCESVHDDHSLISPASGGKLPQLGPRSSALGL
jgi:hypothetical protein